MPRKPWMPVTKKILDSWIPGIIGCQKILCVDLGFYAFERLLSCAFVLLIVRLAFVHECLQIK